jgi:quinohemoprotein ethanol dehydrogenase
MLLRSSTPQRHVEVYDFAPMSSDAIDRRHILRRHAALRHGSSLKVKAMKFFAVRPNLVAMIAGIVLWPTLHASAAEIDWTQHGNDATETNFSELAGINTRTVTHLGLAWSLDLPGEHSLEATPLEVGGVIYFPGSYGKVYAVEALSGKMRWSYDPQTWKFNPKKMHLNFAVNRGVAYAGGRIFSATFDGRLVALDAGTGKVTWTVETTPHDSLYFITGAPRIFDGKVIVGNAGGDYGARAFVTAYDQKSGRQVWRFYVTPGSPEENRGDPLMEQAAASWRGEFWKTGTGGSVWDNITFDAKYHRIYLGTGNGGPTNAEARSPGGGDNLYTASIVALDAASGRYQWHYQLNPHDTWNFDATSQMTLAQITLDGKPHDVLVQAAKNGFVYLIDRTSGKLLSAEKFGKVTWADHIDLATGRPVENTGVRYEHGESVVWPNPIGAHSWQTVSYSPRTGLLYIPYIQNGVRFYKGPTRPNDVNDFGISIGSVTAGAEDGKGALLAWDVAQGKVRWKVQYDFILNGGLLSTAGDLVFQGTADGYLSAYDARSGASLWRFNAGLGIIAPPITYQLHGKQFISILVGWGASAAIGSDVLDVGWKWGGARRLLTFALDATATLPASPARDPQVHVHVVAGEQASAADLTAGKILSMQCIVCHGRELSAAGGPAPDLRESVIPLNRDSFWTVVHDGALLSQGMPQFQDLTREQAEQLRAYIQSVARHALDTQNARGTTGR